MKKLIDSIVNFTDSYNFLGFTALEMSVYTTYHVHAQHKQRIISQGISGLKARSHGAIF